MTCQYECAKGHVTERKGMDEDSMIICRVCRELSFRKPEHFPAKIGLVKAV